MKVFTISQRKRQKLICHNLVYGNTYLYKDKYVMAHNKNNVFLFTEFDLETHKLTTFSFDKEELMLYNMYNKCGIGLVNEQEKQVFGIVGEPNSVLPKCSEEYKSHSHSWHNTTEALEYIANDSENVNDFLIGAWQRFQANKIQVPFSMLVSSLCKRFNISENEATNEIHTVIANRVHGGFVRIKLNKMCTNYEERKTVNTTRKSTRKPSVQFTAEDFDM